VEGYGQQFGTLQAHWGYGSKHDGERYKVHLCELWFFRTLSVATCNQCRFRPRLFATIPPRKPGLSANEPAMICANLQTIAANQDYLRLKRDGSHGKPGRLHLLPKFSRSCRIQRIAGGHTAVLLATISEGQS
ncbi:hypothetical protein ACM7LX_33975, partial [Pseudomonas aeruginosa]